MVRHLAALAVLVLAPLAACGGDDDASPAPPRPTANTPDTTGQPTTTEAPTTTTPPTSTTAVPTTTMAPTTTTEAPTAEPSWFDEPGPYPVGVTTLQLGDGPLVEVWYPAAAGTSGTVSYDVRDFTPPAIQDLLADGTDATFTWDGARDPEGADGRFPVVLFSHGSSSIRVQSSFLTTHLVSHGMIVAAPDHPSRGLEQVLDGSATRNREDAVAELLASLDLLVDEDKRSGSPLAGRVDADRVATLGHSAGGGTALAAASDDRILGYISMSAGGPADGDAFPEVPSFFLAGTLDAIVSPDERSRPAFEAAPTPAQYWELEATGHQGFSDFCTFGGGTGIIGVAEEVGLAGLLDALPQFRTLGEDGCLPPNVPVTDAFPVIRHGVTAWLLDLFGADVGEPLTDAQIDARFPLDIVRIER